MIFSKQSLCIPALIVAGIVCTSMSWGKARQEPADQVALLVEDDVPFDSPAVTVWTDAAAEEGLHLLPIRDSNLRSSPHAYAALIIPDGVHRVADDALVSLIKKYVDDGGHLMLVYDVGTKDPRGFWAKERSRFSELAGIDYALYASLRDHTTQRAPVYAQPSVIDALNIPPGKAMVRPEVTARVNDDQSLTIVTYTYGAVNYPMFSTRGNYNGSVLMRSPAGVVAGSRPQGKGDVLFVNLPLGYVAQRTDGLLLHGFLQMFAKNVGLPTLAAVPDGVGGLVLNWHLDSNAAVKYFPMLDDLGFFQQGPYSIHLTAGPDRDAEGDRLGMDVPNNQKVQEWIRSVMQKGNKIGSHGGWIHNYFGANLNNEDKSFARYIEMNNRALQAVTGSPIVEYSAPVGNQPQWVTEWLQDHGFVAYYFTGNSGMAPTKSYREGVRADGAIWSFPILIMGTAASFEDMHASGVTESAVTDGLRGITDFVSRHRVSRLVYAHPPGVAFYQGALRSWLEKTKAESAAGRFHWYDMTEMAQFLTARQQVRWTATRTANSDWLVQADHPSDLEHQSWFLLKSRSDKPVVNSGQAAVSEDEERWIVVAGRGKRLSFSAHARKQDAPAKK